MKNRSRCELVRSPRKRQAANQRAESIAPNFPPGIAKPALRALAGAGIHQLDDLRRISREDLGELHGMGPKALGILSKAMAEQGFSFRQGR